MVRHQTPTRAGATGAVRSSTTRLDQEYHAPVTNVLQSASTREKVTRRVRMAIRRQASLRPSGGHTRSYVDKPFLSLRGRGRHTSRYRFAGSGAKRTASADVHARQSWVLKDDRLQVPAVHLVCHGAQRSLKYSI